MIESAGFGTEVGLFHIVDHFLSARARISRSDFSVDRTSDAAPVDVEANTADSEVKTRNR